MSSKKISAAVLTLSNRASNGTYDDVSGKVVVDMLKKNNFEVVDYAILPDIEDLIENKLINYTDNTRVNVVFTTGGTGFGSQDVTPEATRKVIEKEIPGIPELIRFEGLKKTKKATLSRAIAGIRGKTLIINLPGSPKGAQESLEAVLDLIPHSIEMIFDKGHERRV